MKTKFLLTAIFALLFVSLVSAADFSISPSTLTFTTDSTEHTFTINNPNATSSLVVEIPSSFYIDDLEFTLSQTGTKTISPGGSLDVTMSLVGNIDYDDFYLGKTYSDDLTITSGTDSESVNVEVKSDFCELGEEGDLEIRDIYLDVSSGFGDDDEWYLLDEIDAEVEVRNSGDEIRTVNIEWAVYNTKTGEFVVDGEEEIRRLEKDTDSVKFQFTLDPSDFNDDDGEGDFVFIVKAYGENKDNEESCASDEAQVTIFFDSDFAALEDLQISDSVECSQTVDISGRVWNIGDYDQDDVSVLIENEALGISEEVTIGSLNKLDSKSFSTSFEVPGDAEERTYYLSVSVLDEDGYTFQNDDDRYAEYLIPLTVEGNCKLAYDVDVAATIDSEAVAGEELKIILLLTNIGTQTNTYEVALSDYLDWAELVSIEPNFVTLDAGEKSSVEITLIPNKDVEGNRDAILDVYYNENDSNEQKIVISDIQPARWFPRLTGGVTGAQNIFIGFLVIAIIVLVVLIVIVSIKVSRRTYEE